jgi:hypothetical protein
MSLEENRAARKAGRPASPEGVGAGFSRLNIFGIPFDKDWLLIFEVGASILLVG